MSFLNQLARHLTDRFLAKHRTRMTKINEIDRTLRAGESVSVDDLREYLKYDPNTNIFEEIRADTAAAHELTRTTIRKMAEMLDNLMDTVNERNRTIGEQNKTINELKKLVSSQDQILSTQDNLIDEQNQIAKKQNEIAQRQMEIIDELKEAQKRLKMD